MQLLGLVAYKGCELEDQVGGIELRRERIDKSLIRACWYFGAKDGGGQVANGVAFGFASVPDCPESASKGEDIDGNRFIVGDGDQCFGRMTIDQLDAEDFGIGESSCGFDFYVVVGVDCWFGL